MCARRGPACHTSAGSAIPRFCWRSRTSAALQVAVMSVPFLAAVFNVVPVEGKLLAAAGAAGPGAAAGGRGEGRRATNGRPTGRRGMMLIAPPPERKEKARHRDIDAELVKVFRHRPTLPRVSRAVPSALEGLTAVFGMGTGVSPPLSSPENVFSCAGAWFAPCKTAQGKCTC